MKLPPIAFSDMPYWFFRIATITPQVYTKRIRNTIVGTKINFQEKWG